MLIHKYKELDLAYRTYGAGDLALLFIHGLGGDGNAWKYQIEYFGDKYRIIVVDLFGHGQSSRGVDPVFAPRIDAEAIDSLMRNEIKQPYFAIGHSFATFTLPEMIKLDDPDLKGVVFVECTYYGFEEIIEARMNFSSLMLSYSDDRLKSEVPGWYLEMVASRPRSEDAEFILSSLKNCNYRWLFQAVAGAREYAEKHPADATPVRDDLPVLVMEADHGIGDDFRKSWVNHFKNAEYYLFENAYHFVFVTEHERFNSRLKHFIEENSAAQVIRT